MPEDFARVPVTVIRNPWWLNPLKSMLILVVLGLAVALAHPRLISLLIPDEVLKSSILGGYLSLESAADRFGYQRRVANAIIAVADRGNYLALAGAFVWALLALVSERRRTRRPGGASGIWIWVFVTLVVALLVGVAVAFGYLSQVDLLPVDLRLGLVLAPALAQRLAAAVIALSLLEFWLICLFVTPPTMQPSVPLASVTGRLLDWYWRVSPSRSKRSA